MLGVGERGWAWAERVSWPWHACETSLVYCLRILRFSCKTCGQCWAGGREVKRKLTISVTGSPTRSCWVCPPSLPHSLLGLQLGYPLVAATGWSWKKAASLLRSWARIGSGFLGSCIMSVGILGA